jgi:hypothetical protein
MYLLAFLDRYTINPQTPSSVHELTSMMRRHRVNISNAAILGLQKDLNIENNKYNTALTIFFVPYVLFEIPSNILLKKLKPHVWCMYFVLMCDREQTADIPQYHCACSYLGL